MSAFTQRANAHSERVAFAEVEIFSRKWWSENQHHSLRSILAACGTVYGG